MATKIAGVPIGTKIPSIDEISPISKELVIGLVGHAGAGTSTAADRIHVLLEQAGYSLVRIKFSELIRQIDTRGVPEIEEGARKGLSRFTLATTMQDRGDKIREAHGDHALAVAAIARLKAKRGDAAPGERKLAFILDSIKHPAEVNLLRKVYDHSFRLVAVHCDASRREEQLIGDVTSTAKYGGAPVDEVRKFMDRDAKDDVHAHGQRVRDAFHLADFFLDNTANSHGGSAMNADISRFVNLLLDRDLVRPTKGERAIYHASAAALQSACLSRQVGAALIAEDGSVIATGTNDPPRFGGGVYDEDSKPDNRCFAWEFDAQTGKFKGCHNDRKKHELYDMIARWMSERLADPIADKLFPKEPFMGEDMHAQRREEARNQAAEALLEAASALGAMPGVKDAIEYSRAIHAEMSALMTAARNGTSTVGTALYVTTYPCHNCARHLVAAGVSEVYFIEPYVKSLASELHSDAITGEKPAAGGVKYTHMLVVPFTGVGPRMFEDFFAKRTALKGARGKFEPNPGGQPFYAVRLHELDLVEQEAMKLVPAVVTPGVVDA
ncbi:MAG: anti-phage dCTP deaminase [Alphaproteobacteria bacterium]